MAASYANVVQTYLSRNSKPPDVQDPILCTRHLEENVRRKLRHDIGASDSSVQTVINDIFGKSGLKSAENECDFDLQAMELAAAFDVFCIKLL
jgi:hypothetical protein